MKIGENTYPVDDVELRYSEVPVTKPTTRGGVYFSDRMVFKIKAKVSDYGIAKTLSSTMLGPNQDFKKILILTTVDVGSRKKELTIFGNLINYVQKSSSLELNMVVVGTELSN
jgi:hypothetical protein